MPAFAEWTICGDRIIFKDNVEAYLEYNKLQCEWKAILEGNAKKAENRDLGKLPPLPILRKGKPELLASKLIGVKPMKGPVKLDEKTRHLYTDNDGNLVLNI